MTSLEDRLRDAYRAVADTVREDELPALYDKRTRTRSRGRFSVFSPVAAAAAVVVAIVVGVAVPKLASSPEPASSEGRSANPVPANPHPVLPRPIRPFVLILNGPDSDGNAGPLVVVSATTGRITGKVPDPKKGTTWYDVALTASGTTFVVAATPTRGGLCNPTYLYTLTLSATGAPASLTPWTDPVVPLQIESITASADGGTLAFVADRCRGAGQQIGVIHGRTMKTWQQPYPELARSLSLSADGSLLGYTESSLDGSAGKARIIDTRSAPGSATAASKTVYTYPADSRAPVLTLGAHGTTMYVGWMTGSDTFHLAGHRIGTGGVQGTLFNRTMPGGESLSWVGSRLLVWDPGVAVYLVDPVTGTATRVQTAWTRSWEIYW